MNHMLSQRLSIKLCESYNRQYGRDFRSIMPTNLYGPNDNFHPENSHVIPALIHRFHNATLNHDEEIKIWGTGNPEEFLLSMIWLAHVFFNEYRKRYFR